MSIGQSLVPSIVFLFSLSLFRLIHIHSRHLVGKDGGSLSLVGPFSKLNERGRTVWRNRCCHVTVPWLRLARWASVWSNVCYGGWRRRIRIGERSEKLQRLEKILPKPSQILLFLDSSADNLLVARSVGVRNWLGLYVIQQSVFFSLLSTSWQSAAQCPFFLSDNMLSWNVLVKLDYQYITWSSRRRSYPFRGKNGIR